MNKENLKYYLIPVGYISSLLTMEFFPNILSVGLFLLILAVSVIALIILIINRRQRTIQMRFVLAAMTLIPIIDLSLGLSNKLRDELKGHIVLSVIDDSFASSKVLTVRQKGTDLMAEYESSVAGFGDTEAADIWINGDTIAFKLTKRKYDDVLVFDRSQNLMKSKNSNSNFRILINQLIK
jgi:hypothetical protein